MDKSKGLSKKYLTLEEFCNILNCELDELQNAIAHSGSGDLSKKKFSLDEISEFIVKNRIPLKFKTEKGELELEFVTSSMLENSDLFFVVLAKSPSCANTDEPFMIDVRISNDFQTKENFFIEMVAKLKELLLSGEITEFKQVKFAENSVSVEDPFPEFNL